MHSSYLAKGKTIDMASSVTTAERMKHCNTAAMYLVQGRVDSCRADTGK